MTNKAFEEWWNTQIDMNSEFDDYVDWSNAKVAWKAALEWVLSKTDPNTCSLMTELRETIIEELGK